MPKTEEVTIESPTKKVKSKLKNGALIGVGALFITSAAAVLNSNMYAAAALAFAGVAIIATERAFFNGLD